LLTGRVVHHSICRLGFYATISTQINQMRSFSSFVRLAPMPFAIATTSVRSHGGCAAGFADNFFQRLLSSLTRRFP
jgi:hypothetical protein